MVQEFDANPLSGFRRFDSNPLKGSNTKKNLFLRDMLKKALYVHTVQITSVVQLDDVFFTQQIGVI